MSLTTLTPLALLGLLFALTLVGLISQLRRQRGSQRELVILVQLIAQLAHERRTG
jgi:hypothetical protein